MPKDYRRIIVWVFAAVLLAGCGGSQYGEVESALETEIDVMTDFVAEMEKADDAVSVAGAIDTYTRGMERLIPQLKAVTEKYPQLETRSDLPEELKAKIGRVGQLTQQMQGAVMKSSRYMMDPQVLKAWQDYGKIMNDMNQMAS